MKKNMRKTSYLVLMPLFLISAVCYGQVPTRNAEKAEITYRVINPANRTVGVGVGAIDSTAIDPFFLGDVTIPEVIYSNNEMFKVVGISDYAFKDCNGIKRVDLGYNISVIGKEAFNGCMGITKVKMPSTLMSIGDRAFEGSSGVETLRMMSQSVAVVGQRALAGCTDLEFVTMWPNQILSVGEGAFTGCTGLKHVMLHGPVIVVAKEAFAGCTNLQDIIISSDSLMNIANGAFQNCENLQKVTIIGKQPVFGTGVFAGCKNLKEVMCITDVPPAAAGGLFANADVSSALLTVSAENAELFKEASDWKGFKSFEVYVSNEKQEEKSDVYEADAVEEIPVFPGGANGLLSFLAKNVRYPAKAMENGIHGRVIVSFVVDVDGSVVEPKVVRSLDPLTDSEALRVVSLMPKWTPAKKNGKPVRVKYNVPITFKLN